MVSTAPEGHISEALGTYINAIGKGQSARELPEAPLAHNPSLAFAVLVCLALAGDGQAIVVHLDIGVFFLQARELERGHHGVLWALVEIKTCGRPPSARDCLRRTHISDLLWLEVALDTGIIAVRRLGDTLTSASMECVVEESVELIETEEGFIVEASKRHVRCDSF